MTEQEFDEMVRKLEQTKIDLEQFQAMVEYAMQSNAQVRKWYEDWCNNVYH